MGEQEMGHLPLHGGNMMFNFAVGGWLSLISISFMINFQIYFSQCKEIPPFEIYFSFLNIF